MINVSPPDYREEARRKLPRFLLDYLDGGAGAEVTLKRNENASAVNLRTMLFGHQRYSVGICISMRRGIAFLWVRAVTVTESKRSRDLDELKKAAD